MCLSGLGIVGYNLGEITYALRHLNRALELSEGHGDKPSMARACYISAICWTAFHQAERTEFFAKRAVDMYNEMGLTVTAYRPLLVLGGVYHLRWELDQAEAIYTQSFTEARKTRDVWLEGWAAQFLGRAAIDRGELPKAEHYFKHAYQLRHEHGEIANEISDLHWLGRLRLAQGQPQAALAHTRQAIHQLETLPTDFYVWEVADVFFGHAQALAANGDADAAAVYFQRAHAELLRFAEQIDDPSVRASLFAYPLYARIVQAWQTLQT